MSFNFGTKIPKTKEVNELDTEMVLTMIANPEMKGSRRFSFSQLAYDTLGFHNNVNTELGERPIITNKVISFGNVANTVGNILNYSFFVNNSGVFDLKEVNVGKTTQGFNDSDIYKKLATVHKLNTSVDNVFDIVRAITAIGVEEEFGIEIYNLIPRVTVMEESIMEELSTTTEMETPLDLETVEFDNNSDVNVTLD
jgi:NADH/NAD ratio-sensing transcriptional regulator Rex